MRGVLRLKLMVLLLVLPVVASAQQPTAPEYNLKAVFIFNFAQFVSWPESAFANPNAPLVIGILGDDPFGAYLDQTVKGEKVNGHPLVVRRFDDPAEAVNAHILFVNLPRQERLEKALKELKGRHVLTVGDTQNFARLGGMIRFFTENNKIRIRVNLDEVKAADLNMSAKLLKLAEVIHNGKLQ